jgi:hypothetical protein
VKRDEWGNKVERIKEERKKKRNDIKCEKWR